jgi:hypothetical protein
MPSRLVNSAGAARGMNPAMDHRTRRRVARWAWSIFALVGVGNLALGVGGLYGRGPANTVFVVVSAVQVLVGIGMLVLVSKQGPPSEGPH